MADPIRTTQRGSAQVIDPRLGLMRLLVVFGLAAGIHLSTPGWILPLVERGVAEYDDGQDAAAPVPAQEASRPGATHEAVLATRHRLLADSIAKRYRVSRQAMEGFVAMAYSAGQATRIDPLLILAVMAVESGFNPIAESVMGAKGLMQVIPQYHPEKFGTPSGDVNVLDPATNILAGARVLREYVARTGDDLVAALALYGGIGSAQDNVYASRVLSEKERLEEVVRRLPAIR